MNDSDWVENDSKCMQTANGYNIGFSSGLAKNEAETRDGDTTSALASEPPPPETHVLLVDLVVNWYRVPVICHDSSCNLWTRSLDPDRDGKFKILPQKSSAQIIEIPSLLSSLTYAELLGSIWETFEVCDRFPGDVDQEREYEGSVAEKVDLLRMRMK